MKWGIEMADKLRIEVWIEGSLLGKLLYENGDFEFFLRLYMMSPN